MSRNPLFLAVSLMAFGHSAAADHSAPITRDDIVRNLVDSTLEGQELDGTVFRIRLGSDRTLTWRVDGKQIRQGTWRVTDDARYCERWQELKERCAAIQIERDLVIMAPPVGTALTMVSGRRASRSITTTVHRISETGVGNPIGTIRFRATSSGVELTPNLAGLSPGPHALHIHENPDCRAAHKHGEAVAGLAAGGHFDRPAPETREPGGTTLGATTHRMNMPGPAMPKMAMPDNAPTYKMAGDLPEIHFDAAGRATASLRSSRLEFHDLFGRAVMIHAHGENPSDPEKAKGGGMRIACGVIPR